MYVNVMYRDLHTFRENLKKFLFATNIKCLYLTLRRQPEYIICETFCNTHAQTFKAGKI